MTKVIFFDIDGVVAFVDFDLLFKNVSRRLGMEPWTLATNYHKHHDKLLIGEMEAEKLLCMTNTTTEYHDFKTAWLEEGLKMTSINKELLIWIESARKERSIAILTNVSALRKMLDETLKLYDHFDYAFLSCDEGMKKPDPRFFTLALEKTSTRPSEAVFVDNTEKYVIAAQKLGIKGMLYRDNETLLKELDELLRATR